MEDITQGRKLKEEEKMGDVTQEKKKRPWEEVLKRRLRIIENPQSIVLVPRTREGMILADLTLALDRGVGRIREDSGTFLPVDKVVVSLKKVDEFTREFSDFINSTFSDGSEIAVYETFEAKKTLASLKRAIVFNPRSLEGKEMARMVKRLDPALVALRNTCTDFSKTEKVFKKLIELIIKFDSLVKELYALLGSSYRSPGMMKKLMEVISPESSRNELIDADVQVQENPEELPRKNKRIGASV